METCCERVDCPTAPAASLEGVLFFKGDRPVHRLRFAEPLALCEAHLQATDDGLLETILVSYAALVRPEEGDCDGWRLVVDGRPRERQRLPCFEGGN